MARSFKPLFLFAAAILALAAPIPGKAAGQPDACKLVDPASAAKLMGGSVTAKPIDTNAAGPDAASMCFYSAGNPAAGFMLLAAHLHPANLATEIARQKREVTASSAPPGTNMAKPKITDVAGIGKAAFLVAMPGFLQVHAFASGAVIVVNQNRNATPDAISQAKAFARLAMKGLKSQ